MQRIHKFQGQVKKLIGKRKCDKQFVSERITSFIGQLQIYTEMI